MNAKATANVAASPCIDVCKLTGQFCSGCFRTLEEIAAWGRMSDTEKQGCLNLLVERRVA